MMDKDRNEWSEADHALGYLARAAEIPHRVEGEAALLEEIPKNAERILDLGTGDGRLLALARKKCPDAFGVALDFSPAMLEAARRRFQGDDTVTVLGHDLQLRLPPLGKFDAVVSSFAIHHCTHERKLALYKEIFELLTPGGVFCNLDHVSSPTQRLHEKFYRALGENVENEDPSNKLLDVETQLRWLREIGFEDVDCYWKWLELALFAGVK